MEVREKTDKEILEILNDLKLFFGSSLFENKRSVINALEVAVEAIENKEDSEKLNKTPFDRVKERGWYCVIGLKNETLDEWEDNDIFDDKQYECSNYFNDKDFAKQVMLHQLLYRKLLKFKLQRDNPIMRERLYYISKDKNALRIKFSEPNDENCNCVYFNSLQVAKQALADVVEPFLKEHPDFIWNW